MEGGRDALPTRTVADPEPQPLARKVGWGLKNLAHFTVDHMHGYVFNSAPDPYVSWPSGSVKLRYESGSFPHQEKIVRKPSVSFIL